MLESIFVLFLFFALTTIVYALWKKDVNFLALGSMLLLASGLLLLDTSPDSGIEENRGFFVQDVGDNNFVIDFNTTFRNAGNDTSINILGNVFFLLGIGGLMTSLGLLIGSRKAGG